LTSGRNVMERITEIQITPIKPKDGLVAFASFVLDNSLYLGSVGIVTRPQGGYRLVYPTKRAGTRDLNVFHPINKTFAGLIENEVIKRYEDVMKKSDDRHNSINTQ
jgi:DNA-binding cell septation regulator SpoVG